MNQYAVSSSSVPPTYTETDGMNYNSKGLWNRAFATFENVPLNNGPKVNNVGYGNYFGGDMGKKKLSNGWSRQFSAYIHITFTTNQIAIIQKITSNIVLLPFNILSTHTIDNT